MGQGEVHRRAFVLKAVGFSSAGLGTLAAVVHILVWRDNASLFVAAALRVLLWAFVLSCVGTLACNLGGEVGAFATKMAKYKWLLVPLLILWIGYSVMLAYSTIFSSPPAGAMLRRVPGTRYDKIYELWASSGYMVAFAVEGVYSRFLSRFG